jgi:hypothetical protein
MGGRFRQVKPGQGDESQRIKRTGARAEETVVKTDAAAGDQRKRQTVQPTLPVLLRRVSASAEIEADADHQQRQDLLKNIGLDVLDQQRAGG